MVRRNPGRKLETSYTMTMRIATEHRKFYDRLTPLEKKLFKKLVYWERGEFSLFDKKEREYIRELRKGGMTLQELKYFIKIRGKGSFFIRRKIIASEEEFWKMGENGRREFIINSRIMQPSVKELVLPKVQRK